MLILGFYTKREEFIKIFENLKNILIITNEEGVKEGRSNGSIGSNGKSNKIKISSTLLEIKKKSCELLMILFDIQTDFKISSIIKEYKKKIGSTISEDIQPAGENSRATKNDTEHIALLREDNELIDGFLMSATQNHRRSEAMRIENEGVTEFFLNAINKPDLSIIPKENEFIDLLISQTLYQDTGLKSLALGLLYTIYREGNLIGERLIDIQIIEEVDSRKMYKEAENISEFLFRQAETMEEWYSMRANREIAELKIILSKIETTMHTVEVAPRQSKLRMRIWKVLRQF